tara:strand:- start:518 stop:739 length:222 start_codon:yes stop_codon:yes gene_type:complete
MVVRKKKSSAKKKVVPLDQHLKKANAKIKAQFKTLRAELKKFDALTSSYEKKFNKKILHGPQRKKLRAMARGQ